LVRTLKQQKTSGNWGDNNPKKVAWTACETALAGSEVLSGGAPKTVVSIKNRWQRLKKEYEIVKDIRNQSGWGWDNTTNLPEVPQPVWDDYIVSHPGAKPYRKKPFPLFDDIADLVGET
ncbi:hypothetical protein BJV77DRAFT_910226, partial [Russula vinacea]